MQIAITLFDRFAALDAVGPYQVFTHLPGAKVIFASERSGPIPDESGNLVLHAQACYADVPAPDIILIPGGHLDHLRLHRLPDPRRRRPANGPQTRQRTRQASPPA